PVVFEADHSVHESEERVVAGEPHVAARLPARPVLAQDDRAAANRLPAENLDPEPLRLAVASVAARTLAFLVRHVESAPRKRGPRRSARPSRADGGRGSAGSACASCT